MQEAAAASPAKPPRAGGSGSPSPASLLVFYHIYQYSTPQPLAEPCQSVHWERVEELLLTWLGCRQTQLMGAFTWKIR